jgi:hypothetical protein
MLNDPWYHKSPQSIEAAEVWGLCSTCSWINFDWLLSHDLRGTILKHNMLYAPMRIPDVELPFGGLAELCARALSCRFCQLVVESFQTAYPEFIALQEFRTTGEKDPLLSNQLRQRMKIGNTEAILGLGSTENGVFEFRARNWTPTIESLDPQSIFFALDNVDKGHNKGVGRYSLQVWLFSAKGGQKIASVQVHRVWEKVIPYQGRRMGKQIDFGLVRAWMEALPPFEREGTSGLPPAVQRDFMLLDAVDECVVLVSQPTKYAALSYVWGTTNTLLHTKDTSFKLQKPQGVSLQCDSVPKTIRDSMQLVLAIGHRYLWVDSLCIIQDDEEYKMLQISNMDSIYRSASFTIVNTNGGHADAGLPGVREDTRSWYQHIQRVGKMNLANRPEMPTYASSPWGERAWTLQEGAMSRRKLFVTPKTVQLHHEKGVFHEDLHPWPVLKRRSEPSKPPLEVLRNDILNLNTNFTQYASIVADYTRRAMTKNTDIVNAFKGLVAAMRPTFRSDFLFGLPISELEHALLWFPETESKRRIHPDTNQPICPSWSWMGWEGGIIQYGSVRAEHLSRVGWIDPANGVLFTSQDIRGISLLDESEWHRITMRSDDSEPVTLEPSFVSQTPLSVAKGWSYRHVGKAVSIPGHDSFIRPLYVDRESAVKVFEHTVVDEEKRKTSYHLEPAFIHQEPHLLTFEALTAKFILRDRPTRLEDFGPDSKNTYKGVRLFGLEDSYGNFAGAVGLHDYPHAESGENVDTAEVSCVVITRTNGPHYVEASNSYPPENDSDAQKAAESLPSQQDEKEEEAFPVYSKFFETVGSVFSSMSDGRPLKWADRPFRCYDFDKPWCLYYVLAVRYEGGKAFRVGCGRCHTDAFWRQGPTRAVVKLF